MLISLTPESLKLNHTITTRKHFELKSWTLNSWSLADVDDIFFETQKLVVNNTVLFVYIFKNNNNNSNVIINVTCDRATRTTWPLGVRASTVLCIMLTANEGRVLEGITLSHHKTPEWVGRWWGWREVERSRNKFRVAFAFETISFFFLKRFNLAEKLLITHFLIKIVNWIFLRNFKHNVRHY